jgi:hypothetical protein
MGSSSFLEIARTMRRLGLLLAALPGLAFAQGVPPLPTVVSVTDLGIVTQNPIVLERDGTYSTEINGHSYWSFNDTAMTEANADGKNFIDNTLSGSTGLDASQGITLDRDRTDATGALARWIPFTKQEAAFQYSHDPNHCTAPADKCGENLGLWPGPITYDPASGTVIVSFGEIVRGGPISGFPEVGAGLATGRVLPNGDLALTRPIQNPGSKYPTLMWSPDEVGYTDQSFLLNGYYYAYGGKGNGAQTQLLLARVPLAKLLDKPSWTYFAGNGVWSSNPADAVPVIDNAGAAGSSIFQAPGLGVWMAVYTRNFTNDLAFRVAYAPEGPWSGPRHLAMAKPGYKGNKAYAGRAHPEYSPDGGVTQYVTYVHSTALFGQDLPLLKVVFGPPK